jgi:hypothetical protein
MLTRVKTLVGRNLLTTVNEAVAAAGLGLGPIDDSPVTEADLAGLPEPAGRYLRFMGVVGRPRAGSFRAHFVGRFRLRPGQRWMPCEAWQINTAPEVNRVFHMRIDFGHLIPMVGRDTYLGGRGCMHGELMGLVTVAHGEGREFDVGELTTYLDDAILLAPSMLLNPAASWSAVSKDSFDISLTDRGRTVTARVLVDEQGAPREVGSEDRYIALPDGLLRARWTTPVHELTIVDGVPQVFRGSAIWHLANGAFEYVQLALATPGVEYNVVLSAAAPRAGAALVGPSGR